MLTRNPAGNAAAAVSSGISPVSTDQLTLNGVTRKGAKAQISGDRHASQIDARQKKLCDNAKAANITIHTVQVNTDSDPTSSALQYCASGTDKFYRVTKADQTSRCSRTPARCRSCAWRAETYTSRQTKKARLLQPGL
jgi:hypothetical protein